MQEQEMAEKVYHDWMQRVQYLEKLLGDLDNNMHNIEILKEQISSFETLRGDEEILAPVANGIFISAKLVDVKKFKVNVGKGIMVDKTIPETLELIEKQEQEIHLTREQILLKLEELYEDAKQF
ncbi:MAG: prefoldin subunit alpha [Candidatus Woesearchaeota archaeon]|jgi:prefoldin alpha subunit